MGVSTLNTDRRSSGVAREAVSRQRYSYKRPYTRFSDGGTYRFRFEDPRFRPFRIG
jgi:hypothetical protein